MSLFVTFEGLDASGKSTQVRLLEAHFRKKGEPVRVLREPGGTSVGESIRQMLLDPSHQDLSDAAELFLFSASRSQLVETVIKPLLEDGTHVICDRFFDSTTAYQGGGRRLDTKMIKVINEAATRGLVPHATFFLDVPIDVLAGRMEQSGASRDRMESNDRDFYVRVRASYLELSRTESRFHVLDGTKPEDDLARQIRSVVGSLEVSAHE